MHLFVSAGEPSGDLHGANLIEALRGRSPGLKVSGFGGPRMAAAGADLHYPLTDLAVMWLGRVIAHLPTFFRIARRAEVHFRTTRPRAVVLIDYPGFHWALAKRAHRAGIPVFYFVPPQLWAWAGWRVSKMRRWVDTVLTALPFEEEWYRSRGVATHYVGHPYFDELAHQTPDAALVAELRKPGTPLVALLPGSRNQEVTANLPQMIAAAAHVRTAVPAARFVLASFNDRQAATARGLLAGSGLPAEVYIGRTPEVIVAADAAIAVSGSVSLELMSRAIPTTVVYRVGPAFEAVANRVRTCRYITLVNLLAEQELFPEFATSAWIPDRIAQPVIEWLTQPGLRAARVTQIRALRDRVAVPGATARAAEFILSAVEQRAACR